MADITLTSYGTVTTAADGINDSVHGQPTTATAAINPVFSSVTRASSAAGSPANFNISEFITSSVGNRSSERGLLQGRRPHSGLLFPRGYYNR
jgi:hypothetical protein